MSVALRRDHVLKEHDSEIDHFKTRNSMNTKQINTNTLFVERGTELKYLN